MGAANLWERCLWAGSTKASFFLRVWFCLQPWALITPISVRGLQLTLFFFFVSPSFSCLQTPSEAFSWMGGLEKCCCLDGWHIHLYAVWFADLIISEIPWIIFAQCFCIRCLGWCNISLTALNIQQSWVSKKSQKTTLSKENFIFLTLSADSVVGGSLCVLLSLAICSDV